VTLPSPPETDEKGNARTFSIASAPHESTVMIATRLRDSAFKRSLQRLSPGSGVRLELPGGDLTLEPDARRPIVILAGGIGITPFRSILLDVTERKLPHRIRLLFSNRRPEDAPFLEELDGLTRRNPNFTMVATMTQPEKSRRRWSGETGKIDRDKIARLCPDFAESTCYVAGPPELVRGLRATAAETGIPSERLRTEEFDGY
jgi:ferredoxin-NADP reductase